MIIIRRIQTKDVIVFHEYDYKVYVNSKLYLTFDDDEDSDNHIDKFIDFLLAANIKYEIIEIK